MKVLADSTQPAAARADLLVLPFTKADAERKRLPARLAAVDQAAGGCVSAALASGDFRGRAGQTVVLYPGTGDANGNGLAANRLLLLGLGDDGAVDADVVRRAAGTAVGIAAARRAARVAIAAPATRKLRPAALGQALAEGAVLSSYRFDSYREKEEDAPGVVDAVVLLFERSGDLRAVRGGAKTGCILAESQNVARDLSNTPANALPPAELGKAAQLVARETGLRCRIFDEKELEKRGMGAILAVGGGSVHPPRLIVMEHNPPSRGAAGAKGKKTRGSQRRTVCIVGKGITFDSGGISIKPSAGMDEMKHDMSGAATVVGLMRACALLKVPLHVVGVIGAAENMPSGTAYRPGDVVKAMSGKTIEVLNTDAEGRVVLADALHYANTEFEPEAIIDLATLTGACVVALGSHATGLFGNNERLVERVRRAGESTAERAWPMPLWAAHRKQIRSEIADIKNTGGREAGSSTAAAFLANFVGDTPWVHLDIAGTGWTSRTSPCQGRGATGVGVRMLADLLRGWKDTGALG